MIILLFLATLLINSCVCHVFRLGECPQVEAMPNFDIDQFLGQWYIIQKFRTMSDCVTENFTKENEQYFVTQRSKTFGSPAITTHSGLITFESNETKSIMKIDYPLSTTGIVNLKQYIVLATDYLNYGLVWNCNRMLIGHRQSAQIMSRTASMDRKIIKELRSIFDEYNIDEHYFTIVNQNNCDAQEKQIENCDTHKNGDKPSRNKPEDQFHKRVSFNFGPFHFSATFPF